jgi:hypothetical protein
VQVLIVNDTMKTIYLGATQPGCNGQPLFLVEDAQGLPLSSPGICTQTCQNTMDGTTPLCPPIACAINSVTTLKPGESLTTQWNGAYMVDAELPPECHPLDSTASCQRIEGVKPGVFLFESAGGTEMDCSQNNGMCQECMPQPNGGCVTYGAIVKTITVKAQAKVTLDGSYGVGGPGGGGMVRAVEIDFQ